MIINYGSRFNQNEWFILILLIVMYTVVFLLPKHFPPLKSIVIIMYAIFVGFFCDMSISYPPYDYYDVNDSSYFEFFDFLSYIMYGPFSYLIVYFYDRFRLGKKHVIPYIILWAAIALGFETAGLYFGVYHYDKGWKIQYSFPSYLLIISVLFILYYKLCRQEER